MEDTQPVIIIGAGLAGLAAAVTLHEKGRRVLLLEASDGIGGRVRTDHSEDGFLLDRGFQVLFTSYPTAQDLLDLPRLNLHYFGSGALVAGSQPMELAIDPFAHPDRIGDFLRRSPFDLYDIAALARLKVGLAGPGPHLLTHAVERTASEELTALGVSERARDRFFRPFFGGIFLDRSLQVRAPWFLFVFKMLSDGRTAVPATGMGAIPNELAQRLPLSAIRLHAPVTRIERSSTGVQGVWIGDECVTASTVIVAADLWRARELLPELPVVHPLGCTTMYFASDTSLYDEPLIVLNPDQHGLINEAAQLTNVAPEYAPPGQHLISCTALGQNQHDDETVIKVAKDELVSWFGARAKGLRPLRLYRLPHAQFAQTPGWRSLRPSARSATPGLYLAGEYLQSSSINGALYAGIAAGRVVLADGR
ncbi:MAG: FAD-dependent oxidoreductase [Chloroflexi bacterium]|nr:FAD-dependent oxidoreductase [Chloroflexota bacterium]